MTPPDPTVILAVGRLCETAKLKVLGSDYQAMQHPSPSTFIGSGKVDELFDKVFVFAHPPISPICRTPLFPYLTFYSTSVSSWESTRWSSMMSSPRHRDGTLQR